MSKHLNNRKIAINTVILYIRTAIAILISLYTSRIVLNTLGVVDYGIFNIVGGVVLMLAFLNNAMASSTMRYFNYEMGKSGGDLNLKKIFSVSLTIHVVIALVVFLLAETVGLWFVNNKIDIPSNRMSAANWVYQFAVFSSMIALTQVPYTAAVMAREKMEVYGIINIIDVVLKLGSALLLLMFSSDRLKLYAVFMFLSSFIVMILYRIYCKKMFDECVFVICKDKKLYKDILGYSSWMMFGATANILNTQGQNVVLNIFFGPAINAARAVASNVNSAISHFVLGFMTASRPQIVKTYAAKEYDNFLNLIFRSSRYSFYLLTVLAIPVILQTEYIMELWLINPPDYAVQFCRLTIIDTLVCSVSGSLMTAASATRKIKKYQIFVGGILLINLPIAYFALKIYNEPTVPYIVTILISIIALFGRLFILKDLITLPVMRYIKDVVIKPWLLFAAIAVVSFVLTGDNANSILGLAWRSILSVFLSLIFVLLFGITKNERMFIFKILKSKFAKKI